MADSNLKHYLGCMLKKHIRTANVKQLEVADALGISASAVSQMLSGRMCPSYKQLEIITELLSLDRTVCAELRDCITRIRSGDEEVRSPLNDFIKSARIKCGLSIEKLSAKTGIPEENLQMLENRLNVQPTPYEAIRLAAVFGCKVNELWQVQQGVAAVYSQESSFFETPMRDNSSAYYAETDWNQLKRPVIMMSELKKFNKEYDQIVDFAWRHMVGYENSGQPGLLLVKASGSDFGWTDLYNVRMEIAEINQWLPGMTVLCKLNEDIVLAHSGENKGEIIPLGEDEAQTCEICWLVNSFSFNSDLFPVINQNCSVHKCERAAIAGKQRK